MHNARVKLTKINRSNKKKIAFAVIAAVIFGIFGLETLYSSKVNAAQGMLHKMDLQESLVHSSEINIFGKDYRAT